MYKAIEDFEQISPTELEEHQQIHSGLRIQPDGNVLRS